MADGCLRRRINSNRRGKVFYADIPSGHDSEKSYAPEKVDPVEKEISHGKN
jgi:hypothetical protein